MDFKNVKWTRVLSFIHEFDLIAKKDFMSITNNGKWNETKRWFYKVSYVHLNRKTSKKTETEKNKVYFKC